MEIVGRSINSVTILAARQLQKSGHKCTRKGTEMLEMGQPVQFGIKHPHENTLLLHGRRGNPWANLAEFPWLICGRNDVAWLENYLPRAAQFSDDGRTWRAGYGPRIRKWDGGHPGVRFDQLQRVVDLLRADPDTRQAVISLWDPLADLAPQYRGGQLGDMTGLLTGDPAREHRFKDYPCTNRLQFIMVNGALDLAVDMRSNDLFWGFSAVNVLNFTLLQDLVACVLDVPVGRYWHSATNLHVYDRHLATLDTVASNAADAYEFLPALRHFVMPLELRQFTDQCVTAMQFIEDHRIMFPVPREYVDAELKGLDPWIREWVYFMLLKGMDKLQALDIGMAREYLEGVGRPDWRMAATEYVARLGMRVGWWSQPAGATLVRTVARGLGATVVGHVLTHDWVSPEVPDAR